MSYDIDAVTIDHGELRILREDFHALETRFGSRCPEFCFLHYEHEKDGKYFILLNLKWHGNNSGELYDGFIEHVIPRLVGKAIVYISWEGPGDVNYFLIDNGLWSPINPLKIMVEKYFGE